MRLGFERMSGKAARSAWPDTAAAAGVEENVLALAAGAALVLDCCSSRKVTLE